MNTKVLFFGSLFLLCSLSSVKSEAISTRSKDKSGNGTTNHQGNISHTLENESTDELVKKNTSPSGMNGINNGKVEFMGQSKTEIKGESNETVTGTVGGQNAGDTKASDEGGDTLQSSERGNNVEQTDQGKSQEEQNPSPSPGNEPSGDQSSKGDGQPKVATQDNTDQTDESDTDNSVQSTEETSASGGERLEGALEQQRASARENPGETETTALSSADPARREAEPETLTNAGQVPTIEESVAENQKQQSIENGQTPKVKYLDKLYDDVLKADEKNQIHVSEYHSKFNNFRKNYEFSMNEREYDIVKNLFGACFKKDNNSNVACLIDVFKKVLEDEKFQKEFDNFVHGLYGFAKRHNYLRGERMNLTDEYKSLFLNALSYLNTIIME
ncbi:merozoite surface protein 7 [Plasmodium gonderi]|uniref:Merozoite surface protein 7 n=1 Tax=Plasmodium gonderi TaxID=77519 RepID=A0A1Y1JMZ6_PLAGO|nr:merozoite surface protein 7 [Plasmodium gonderi]GAW82222.1 merozoite surface protein 7 [Plasmodium gonderi]